MADNNGCRGCGHYRPLTGFKRDEKACHYLLDMGHSRGCPAENCDKRTDDKVDYDSGPFVRGDYMQKKDW